MYSERDEIKLSEGDVFHFENLQLRLQNAGLQVELARSRVTEIQTKYTRFIDSIYSGAGVTRSEYDLSSCGKKLVRKKGAPGGSDRSLE